jgi:hypothetical protein
MNVTLKKEHCTDRDIIEEILERTRWIENNLNPSKKNMTIPKGSPFEIIISNWQNIVDRIKMEKIALGSFLNEGRPTSLKDNQLEIKYAVDSGYHIKTIIRNSILVEKTIKEITGYPVKIKCTK